MSFEAINSLFVGHWESVLSGELLEHSPTAFLKPSGTLLAEPLIVNLSMCLPFRVVVEGVSVCLERR